MKISTLIVIKKQLEKHVAETEAIYRYTHNLTSEHREKLLAEGKSDREADKILRHEFALVAEHKEAYDAAKAALDDLLAQDF